MNKHPLVSVIMPSFNQMKFIEEAILSVLNQSYENIELIIIDGESTDKTITIINKYIDRVSTLIIEKDDGPVSAINKGLRLSKGDFQCILFSDDVLCADSINASLNYFEQNTDVDFLYRDVEIINENSDTIKISISNEYPVLALIQNCHMPIKLQSSIWKRDILYKIGYFDPMLGVAADWDFFLRALLNCKVAYLPGITGKFRDQANSQSSRKQLDWIELVPSMYKKLFKLSPDFSSKVKKTSFSNISLYRSSIFLQNNYTLLSFRELLNAVSIYPPIISSKKFWKILALCTTGI